MVKDYVPQSTGRSLHREAVSQSCCWEGCLCRGSLRELLHYANLIILPDIIDATAVVERSSGDGVWRTALVMFNNRPLPGGGAMGSSRPPGLRHIHGLHLPGSEAEGHSQGSDVIGRQCGLSVPDPRCAPEAVPSLWSPTFPRVATICSEVALGINSLDGVRRT